MPGFVYHQGMIRILGGLPRIACAVFMAAELLSCATAEPVPEPPTQALSQYLATVRDAQDFPIETLYQPPSDEDYGLLFLLADSPVVLDLDHNATAFAAWRKGLAVGFADGQVRVYGQRSCSGLKEPLPGAVDLLAWGPFSRYLAATDDSGRPVHIIDLETCSVIRTMDTGLTAKALAVSDVGASLAVLDSAGRLYMGPPKDKLESVADLDAEIAGMGFAPGEGVLAVVDSSGRTTLVNAKDRQVMDGFTIPGGPFAGVRFVDTCLALETRFGSRLAFDLIARQPVPYSRQLDQFFLEDGQLRYRTWTDVLHVTPFRGWTGLRVEYSPSQDAIRVWDVDGTLRHYSARDGLERGCVSASDWRAVPTNEKGNFCLGETCYILSDVAFHWDHDQLLCRWIEGRGFYLWWRKTSRPDQYSPLPDHLPQRTCILADRPAVWRPVIPPPDFP